MVTSVGARSVRIGGVSTGKQDVSCIMPVRLVATDIREFWAGVGRLARRAAASHPNREARVVAGGAARMKAGAVATRVARNGVAGRAVP